VKSEVSQFGTKVAKGAGEVVDDIKDFIFDEAGPNPKFSPDPDPQKV
jgi:hypothetical protein